VVPANKIKLFNGIKGPCPAADSEFVNMLASGYGRAKRKKGSGKNRSWWLLPRFKPLPPDMVVNRKDKQAVASALASAAGRMPFPVPKFENPRNVVVHKNRIDGGNLDLRSYWGVKMKHVTDIQIKTNMERFFGRKLREYAKDYKSDVMSGVEPRSVLCRIQELMALWVGTEALQLRILKLCGEAKYKTILLRKKLYDVDPCQLVSEYLQTRGSKKIGKDWQRVFNGDYTKQYFTNMVVLTLQIVEKQLVHKLNKRNEFNEWRRRLRRERMERRIVEYGVGGGGQIGNDGLYAKLKF